MNANSDSWNAAQFEIKLLDLKIENGIKIVSMGVRARVQNSFISDFNSIFQTPKIILNNLNALNSGQI